MPDAEGIYSEAEWLAGLAQERDDPGGEIPMTWVDASGSVGFSFVGGVKRWWEKVDGEWREYVDG